MSGSGAIEVLNPQPTAPAAEPAALSRQLVEVRHELGRNPREGSLLRHRGGDRRGARAATRSYIRAETSIDRDRREVTLPRLLRLYRADFGPAGSRLRFVTARLMPDDAEWLRGNRDRISIDYGDYDWTISLAG